MDLPGTQPPLPKLVRGTGKQMRRAVQAQDNLYFHVQKKYEPEIERLTDMLRELREERDFVLDYVDDHKRRMVDRYNATVLWETTEDRRKHYKKLLEARLFDQETGEGIKVYDTYVHVFTYATNPNIEYDKENRSANSILSELYRFGWMPLLHAKFSKKNRKPLTSGDLLVHDMAYPQVNSVHYGCLGDFNHEFNKLNDVKTSDREWYRFYLEYISSPNFNEHGEMCNYINEMLADNKYNPIKWKHKGEVHVMSLVDVMMELRPTERCDICANCTNVFRIVHLLPCKNTKLSNKHPEQNTKRAVCKAKHEQQCRMHGCGCCCWDAAHRHQQKKDPF